MKDSSDNREIEISLQIFEKLESFHTQNSVYRNPKTLVDILNNIACCYRRINSLDPAIEVLNRALKISKSNNLNSGLTYTNLSAIYSQKKLVHKALKICQQAIGELYPLMLQEKTPENIKLLAITYYNLGNQECLIKDYESSIVNYNRGIKLLNDEDYPENDPVLIKLQVGCKQAKALLKKVKIEKGAGVVIKRPTSAGLRPNSAHSKQSLKNFNQSKFSNNNQSSLNRSRIFAQFNKKTIPFDPRTSKRNPALTTFNQMQWRTSDEYTHNDDNTYNDRVHLHTNLKPQKLSAYKSTNPILPAGFNSSKLQNKSTQRKTFDGSRNSINQSREVKKQKTHANAREMEQEDDFLYLPADDSYVSAEAQYRQKQLKQAQPKITKKEVQVNRNQMYDLQEDEKELLDDSWQENVSDNETEGHNKNERIQKSISEKQQMASSRKKFYHAIKEQNETINASQSEKDKFQVTNINDDLEDWQGTKIDLTQNKMFREKVQETFYEPQQQQPSGGDRCKTAGGLRFRTLDEEKQKKKRDLDSRRKELKSPQVNYINSSDLRNSNLASPNERESEVGMTHSLLVENNQLKRRNQDLMRALEEERSKNRIKELQKERQKYMSERDSSARVIQRGWVSNSFRRSEKRRIENLKKYGFTLIKKSWTAIPRELGGYSPSKVMVFENNSTSTLTVIAEDVKTNQVKNVEIKIGQKNTSFAAKELDKKCYLTKEGQLEIRDISVKEVSLSDHNTEEPLIDKDEQVSFDRIQMESPLFPTEKSRSLVSSKKGHYELEDI